jgi:hypothetical protein
MTYQVGGLVQALDYNALVGGNPTATANTLNVTWATGSGSAGYGQTAEANVAAGSSVAASNWAGLVNKTANASLHQGSTISSVTAPVTGGIVTFLSAIPTNLQTIYTNRLNATSQSGVPANTVTRSTTWTNSLTFTHTVTFANGDAARYFFNSGGQLKMTVSHANATTPINALFNTLATNVGTVVISAPSSGTANIAGTTYNGITRVGPVVSNPSTISPNNGYYALTTSNVTVFSQTAASGPTGYLGSKIEFLVNSNGTVGTNGDRGNVITIHTIWDEIPDGLIVGENSTTTLTVMAPANNHISNTWGTITLTGTVTGS